MPRDRYTLIAGRLVAGLLLTVLTVPAPGALAEGEIEPAGPPPEELGPATAAVLVTDGLRVRLDGEPVWELWTLREPPESADGEAAFGQELAALPAGGLVGAVRLLHEWSDYRGTRIGPGLYTLRYLVEPADGAHLGTALYRDFALLVPAGADGGPGETYGFDDLLALSRRATGTNHPAVMALFPDWSVADGEAEAPAVADNEIGQPTLLVAIGDLRFGLVVAGHGDV